MLWSPAGRRAVFRRAILRAVEIMEKSKDDGHRLRAIELLCAYAAGKPKQSMQLDIVNPGSGRPMVQIVLNRSSASALEGAIVSDPDDAPTNGG